jgi:hypothetical protein
MSNVIFKLLTPLEDELGPEMVEYAPSRALPKPDLVDVIPLIRILVVVTPLLPRGPSFCPYGGAVLGGKSILKASFPVIYACACLFHCLRYASNVYDAFEGVVRNVPTLVQLLPPHFDQVAPLNITGDFKFIVNILVPGINIFTKSGLSLVRLLSVVPTSLA